MAPDGVEEADYESDPEELKRSLATRRREASDDEDENLGEIHSADIDSDEQKSAIVEFDNDADEGSHIEGDDSYDEDEEGDYGDDDEDSMEYNKTTSVDGKAEPKGMEAVTEDSVVDGEEPKQKEPFAVPTAGAFYMHDDRFQEMDVAPNRRMRGGRRLWPSRDERKWGHDKYDELNTQEKQNDKRTSRGRARGRGQGRGQERGYSRESNSNVFTKNGHQNQFLKSVTRGRGRRRYDVTGSQAPSVQTKQSQNSFVNPGRAPTETDSIDAEAKINVVASSLNSASPPFYPSGSSNSLAQKDLQAGMGRLHVNGSPTPSGKKFGSTKSSSSWVRTTPSQTTSQVRGAPALGKVLNQGDNVISPMQIRGISQGAEESFQSPGLDTETGVLVANGKGTLQPSGRGSFMYGGTQFMGPGGGMAAGHGNPDFPAFLPVMQFGGQHGGVPTFGVALPGYVQPEHGTRNPEMTWLPILTGPGSLGASYPPPYAAIDGSYQVHKPGLPSSAGSFSLENSSKNPTDEEKPVERHDVTNNGTTQRSNSNPNKQPRRYSEMSFSK
ncbi:Protein MLN51 [Hirschfeldia incana]|nr:Protein MLN51 [Hirschfeldia incana]KAJ0256727.1 Protein MLN51 [Hirschfeldia incana]KAJ0256728.1 Protein MLN51 [Hirschfeldia incana]